MKIFLILKMKGLVGEKKNGVVVVVKKKGVVVVVLMVVEVVVVEKMKGVVVVVVVKKNGVVVVVVKKKGVVVVVKKKGVVLMKKKGVVVFLMNFFFFWTNQTLGLFFLNFLLAHHFRPFPRLLFFPPAPHPEFFFGIGGGGRFPARTPQRLPPRTGRSFLRLLQAEFEPLPGQPGRVISIPHLLECQGWQATCQSSSSSPA